MSIPRSEEGEKNKSEMKTMGSLIFPQRWGKWVLFLMEDIGNNSCFFFFWSAEKEYSVLLLPPVPFPMICGGSYVTEREREDGQQYVTCRNF